MDPAFYLPVSPPFVFLSSSKLSAELLLILFSFQVSRAAGDVFFPLLWTFFSFQVARLIRHTPGHSVAFFSLSGGSADYAYSRIACTVLPSLFVVVILSLPVLCMHVCMYEVCVYACACNYLFICILLLI